MVVGEVVDASVSRLVDKSVSTSGRKSFRQYVGTPWSDPTDLCLPFPEFRPVQTLALTELEQSSYKINLVQAPTGTGKTLLAAAYARLNGGKCLYTCHSRDLQRQFLADFPYAEILMGRSNYPTLTHPAEFPDVSCAECDKKFRDPDKEGKKTCSWCEDVDQCPYQQAKDQALKAELCVVNTAYFMLEANHIGRFSNWDLVVLDEGDLIEQALMSYVEVEFSQRLLKRLGLVIPDFKGVTKTEKGLQRKVDEWGGWLKQLVIPALQKELQLLGNACHNLMVARQTGKVKGSEYTKKYSYLLKQRSFLERTVENVTEMVVDLTSNPESWVRVDDSDSTLRFKPIKVARYAEPYLWKHGKKFLVMSGSIISKTQFCTDLGLDPAEVGWLDLPCTFPVVNRPVYVWPVTTMTFANKGYSYPKLVEAIDELLTLYVGHRTLIHVHTYELARYVYSHCFYSDLMVVYNSASERAAALERYKATPGAVLVAPSFERGISLDDDLCRLQIISKVPYPNLKDRQVAARFREPWYRVQTVRSITQMTGRGNRSEEDWCDTWILDGEFIKFYRGDRSNKGKRRYPAKELFADWWQEGLTDQPAAVKAALERGPRTHAGR